MLAEAQRVRDDAQRMQAEAQRARDDAHRVGDNADVPAAGDESGGESR